LIILAVIHYLLFSLFGHFNDLYYNIEKAISKEKRKANEKKSLNSSQEE
jgi:hypothetical protein